MTLNFAWQRSGQPHSIDAHCNRLIKLQEKSHDWRRYLGLSSYNLYSLSSCFCFGSIVRCVRIVRRMEAASCSGACNLWTMHITSSSWTVYFWRSFVSVVKRKKRAKEGRRRKKKQSVIVSKINVSGDNDILIFGSCDYSFVSSFLFGFTCSFSRRFSLARALHATRIPTRFHAIEFNSFTFWRAISSLLLFFLLSFFLYSLTVVPSVKLPRRAD